MPTAASHRAASAKPRHRKGAGLAQAVYPTFRLDASATSAVTPPAYARHIGRIGALAVALGVGVALANGGAVARADEGGSDSSGSSTSSGSTSSSGSTASSTATSSSADATAGATSDPGASSSTPSDATKSASSSSTSTSESGPKVPEMKVSASGGANTSVGDSTTATTGTVKTSTDETVPTATAEAPTEPSTEPSAEPTTTPAKQTVETTDPAPKHARPTEPTAPTSADPAPTAATPVVHREAPTPSSTAAETEPAGPSEPAAVATPGTAVEAAAEPEPEATEALPTVAAAALAAVLAPLGLPGPAAPVQSPLLWAVLAWTRRQSQSDETSSDTTAATTGTTAARFAANATTADAQTEETAAYNDIYSTLVDTPVSGNVLANDTAPAGDTLVVDSYTTPSNGSLTMATDGSFTYTPKTDYVGYDEFTYTARNTTDDSTSSTVVSIEVMAPNLPPAAVDDSFTTTSGVPITNIVTSNDSDPEGESIVVEANTTPAHGTVTIDNTGVFTYTPEAGFSGVDTFTYTIQDPHQQTATATVTITVTPVAADDTASTAMNMPVSISVLDNDSGTALSVTSVSPPGSGTVTPIGIGGVIYTPSTGFYGVDVFGYSVVDASGNTATATVIVSVERNVNYPPSTADDVYSGYQGSVLEVDAAHGVLANDNDPEAGPLYVVAFSQPAVGTVFVRPDGSFTYQPAAGYFGHDQFTYTAADSLGATSTARVDITVMEIPNLPPVASPGAPEVTRNTTYTFDPTAYGYDPEGQPLTATILAQPAHGVVTANEDGTFSYTPMTGFMGSDVFSYQLSDGVHTTPNTLTFNVIVGNQPPVANDDTATFGYGEQAVIDVLANDSDPDGDELYLVDYGIPTHGTTSGFGSGAIEYTPDADWSGTDSFTYTVSDAAGNTATATVTVTILPRNHAPTAADDEATTSVNTPIDINVLANDVDSDGDWLTVTIEAQPDHGKVTVGKDGTLHYTPAPDWVGTDWLTYSVTDPGGLTSYASVKITVKGKDDPGTPSEPSGPKYTASAGKTLTMGALAGVLGQDVLSQGAGAGLIETTTHGVLQLNKDGSFTYTPDKGFVGTDTFSYYYGTSEWADGPFTATIEVVPFDGTEISAGVLAVANGSGGMPSCTNNWFPSQYDRDEVWPLCLSPEIRLPNRM